MQAQNAQIATALTQRQTVEVRLPAQAATLTSTQAATTIAAATKGEATAVGDNVQIDLPTARNIASMVQLLPLLQQDKADLQKALDNETHMYTNEVAAHKKDNEANAKTVTALKADCRRSKLKWLGIGIVIGFVGRGFAGF